MDLTLVVMAAGMGSRFGGIKQMEQIGPSGELIIDYSVYDALRSGFNKVVFIIRKDIEQAFKETIGNKLEKHIKVEYAFQDNSTLPREIDYPKDRVKPWGTAHAVLCAKNNVNSPFAVINADDFYGYTSFQKLADYLKELGNNESDHKYCMVGFNLFNTLSESGYVSRGVCSTDDNGNLKDIVEHTKILKNNNKAEFTIDNKNWTELSSDTVVSMNTWGFTQDIFNEIESGMFDFLNDNLSDLDKVEYYLPFVVDKLIKQKKADVKVIPCSEKWYGITYKEDKSAVVDAIKDMVDKGIYPQKLW